MLDDLIYYLLVEVINPFQFNSLHFLVVLVGKFEQVVHFPSRAVIFLR